MNNTSKQVLALFVLALACCFWQGSARICTCEEALLVAGKRVVKDERLAPNDSSELDICDFDCPEYCTQQVRLDLGNDAATINDDAREKMCERAFSQTSLFKDGIEVRAVWDLQGCNIDDEPRELVVSSNTCCRFCRCSYGLKTLQTGLTRIDDLSDSYTKIRSFKCTDLDANDECETYCRDQLATRLNFPQIRTKQTDQFEILSFPKVADDFCMANGNIYSPGVELYGFIETGPKAERWHKEISMGTVCCQRQCKCEIYFENWKDKNETMIADLTSSLRRRPPSYECGRELDNCLADCRELVADKISNQDFKDLSKSPMDINPLAEFKTARKICMLIKKHTLKEGIKVFLRYQTAESDKYPRAQNVLLGRLCCSRYLGVDYFPFNNCDPWDVDVPIDLSESESYQHSRSD